MTSVAVDLGCNRITIIVTASGEIRITDARGDWSPPDNQPLLPVADKPARKANPMFDEVARVWNLHPKVHGSRIAKVARDLSALGATVEAVEPAHRRAVAAWGDRGQTPECLVKHWAKFGAAAVQHSPATKWVSGA